MVLNNNLEYTERFVQLGADIDALDIANRTCVLIN